MTNKTANEHAKHTTTVLPVLPLKATQTGKTNKQRRKGTQKGNMGGRWGNQ